MALAMDARAYGFKANRTSMVEYSFGRREAVFFDCLMDCRFDFYFLIGGEFTLRNLVFCRL